MKKIKSIKKGLLGRNSSLLKFAVKTGVSIIKNKDNPKKIIEDLVGVDPDKFVDDLSHYKGSITKAGQLISQYGEYYLSPEVNKTLKKLQSSTHFLDFEKIKDQINTQAQIDLEIESSPLAAASIGQVHKAIHKESDKAYALKIQYKGIEKAIKGDLIFIKMLTSSLKIIPKGVDATDIFSEIEDVLRKEMDYKREASILNEYRNLLQDDFFYIPKVYPEFSNDKTLCLEFIDGVSINAIDELDVSQEKRNVLGEKIFELFLKEIFEFHIVQTDAHGGNFFINNEASKLFLLDFGACLKFEEHVLKFYQDFLSYSFKEDKDGFIKSFESFKDYTGKSLKYDEDKLWEYMHLASSPLRSKNFNWKETTLPDDLYSLGKELHKTMEFDSIPSQFIFLDRKVMGVFTLLRNLKCEFDVQKVFKKFL